MTAQETIDLISRAIQNANITYGRKRKYRQSLEIELNTLGLDYVINRYGEIVTVPHFIEVGRMVFQSTPSIKVDMESYYSKPIAVLEMNICDLGNHFKVVDYEKNLIRVGCLYFMCMRDPTNPELTLAYLVTPRFFLNF